MARLISVNVGLPRDVAWHGQIVHTSIWKTSVAGRRMVRRLNVDGDRQGDRLGHGGEQRPRVAGEGLLELSADGPDLVDLDRLHVAGHAVAVVVQAVLVVILQVPLPDVGPGQQVGEKIQGVALVLRSDDPLREFAIGLRGGAQPRVLAAWIANPPQPVPISSR